MALSCERTSARIKVQVVATMLPLNIPVHVDPFWTLIKFQETQTISDVENKIISSLNSLAKLASVELAVHEGPISPSWTYLPVTPSNLQNKARPTQADKKFGKDPKEQQLTILLKPHFCQYISGEKKTTPPWPVLIGFDISSQSPSKLIFWKQLVFLHDSVLLGDSKSEILRDKDVIVINALCDFIFERHDNSSSLKNVDASNVIKNSLFWDAEEESNAHDVELLPEIKRKVDKLLQKLRRLEQLQLNCEQSDSSTQKPSKKRKANQRDSDTEIGNNFNTESTEGKEKKQKKQSVNTKISNNLSSGSTEIREKHKKKHSPDAEMSNNFSTESIKSKEKKQKKQLADGQMSQDSDLNMSDALCSRSKKMKKKRYESDIVISDEPDTSLTTAMYENTKSSKIQSLNSKEVELGHLTTCMMESSVPNNDRTNQAVELGDVGFAGYKQIKDAHQKPLSSKEKDKVQVSTSSVVVASSPKKNFHRAYRSAGLGVSSLLLELRNQQASEIKTKESEPDINVNENGKPIEKNVLQVESVTPSTPVEHQGSAQVTPKRRRVRKKKNKKAKSDINTSNVENPENMNRDYSLRFPEHQMPQNTRVTFECDSEDDAEHENQTDMEAQSTPQIQQYSSGNNTANNKVTSHSQDISNHAVNITTSSDNGQAPFSEAGVPINPDGKFQALLHQYGRKGRQFETISSESGHTVIRSSRQRRKKSNARMSDAVDPEKDVLTNVSFTAQHNLPTPNKLQAKCAAAGDSHENPPVSSQPSSLSISHVNNTKQHNNCEPLVEVTPLYMKYDSCQPLCGVPVEGDIIVYKILELSEDYTPALSKFKEAKVINVDTQSGSLLLEPREKIDKRRSGRFEMSLDDVDNSNTEQDDNWVTVALADLVDTRLLLRTAVQ